MGVTNSVTDLPITNLKGAYIICSTGIVGKFAKQLDVALDDGNPATGTVMAAIPSSSVVAAEPSPDDNTLYTVCQGV